MPKRPIFFLGCADVARHISEKHGIQIDPSSIYRAYRKVVKIRPCRVNLILPGEVSTIIDKMPRLKNRIARAEAAKAAN